MCIFLCKYSCERYSLQDVFQMFAVSSDIPKLWTVCAMWRLIALMCVSGEVSRLAASDDVHGTQVGVLVHHRLPARRPAVSWPSSSYHDAALTISVSSWFLRVVRCPWCGACATTSWYLIRCRRWGYMAPSPELISQQLQTSSDWWPPGGWSYLTHHRPQHNPTTRSPTTSNQQTQTPTRPPASSHSSSKCRVCSSTRIWTKTNPPNLSKPTQNRNPKLNVILELGKWARSLSRRPDWVWTPCVPIVLTQT